MARKFPNIKYNLSTNIIRYNEEMESLKNHSLNLCIGEIFKKSVDIKWIKRVSNCKGLNPIHYEEWRRVEKGIDDQLFDVLNPVTYYILTPHLIKTKIHFIGMQILNFLSKYAYLSTPNLSKLLRYVVFNSRGIINTVKIFERNWKASYLLPFYSFELISYQFSETNFKPYLKGLTKYTKRKNIASSEKGDFLELRLRETRTLNQFTSERFTRNHPDSYAEHYEKFFFIAIDMNNDIGVEYLWLNKISKMEKGRSILEKALKLIVDNPLKIDIMMFLLFQVNENEFEDFFRFFSFNVIENVIKDVRWHCVFDKLIDVLKFYFNSDMLSKIFDILANSHCQEYPVVINLDLVVNYFSSLPESAKVYILRMSTPNPSYSLSSNQDESPYERVLYESITSIEDDYLEKLLKVEDGSALEDFFSSEPGINLLIEADLIDKLNRMYELLGKVVNEELLFNIRSHFITFTN
ncbi:UNVERIFIED_CONTAM: hypothetical protein RMT77_011353 [Armadillidium vulgare]